MSQHQVRVKEALLRDLLEKGTLKAALLALRQALNLSKLAEHLLDHSNRTEQRTQQGVFLHALKEQVADQRRLEGISSDHVRLRQRRLLPAGAHLTLGPVCMY